MKHRHIPIIVLSVSLLFAGCNSGSSNNHAEANYIYSQPAAINDGWETGTLTSVGMDEQLFLDMVDYLNGTRNHEVHSILYTFSARGWAGQYIMGLPKLGMVVVFTGGNYVYDPKNRLVNLLRNYILPSALE